jgi:predicted RNA-binding protein with PIN domain
VWIIDAFNVLGARPDGWWRDRPAALARLVDEISRWRPEGADVLVVVDGWPDDVLPEGTRDGVAVRYAHRRGPDAADEVIAALVRGAADPAGLTVVTSDARLRDSVVRSGAAVEGAGTFRRRLDDAE